LKTCNYLEQCDRKQVQVNIFRIDGTNLDFVILFL
jgi:hypothetical protein